MTTFSSPVPKGCRFTSGFGQRWGTLHAGTDWAPPKPGQTGIPIFAPVDMTIIAVGYGYGRASDRIPYHSGRYIWADAGVIGGDRMRIYLGHLDSYSVKPGQKVKAGEQVAIMGGSGRTGEKHFAIHLHMGVSQNHTRPIAAAKGWGDPGWIDSKTWLQSKGVRIGVDAPVTPGKVSTSKAPSGDYETITSIRSDNYFTPAETLDHYGVGREIEAIVVHHWGVDGQTLTGVANYLSREDGNTSAHEVTEGKTAAELIDHKNTAWHARHVNPTTLGLELRPEADDDDYATAAKRIRKWRDEHGPLPLRAHSDEVATACPGRWDIHRLDKLAGGGGGVDTSHRGNGAAPSFSGPSKPSGLEWPENLLYVDGKFQSVTKRAYQRLLAPAPVGAYKGRVDADFGSLSVKAEQRWLKRLGYYKGRIDGDRGPMTIKALQRFLRDRGFYGGWIDGDFAGWSVKGLQEYLNSQRQYYI